MFKKNHMLLNAKFLQTLLTCDVESSVLSLHFSKFLLGISRMTMQIPGNVRINFWTTCRGTCSIRTFGAFFVVIGLDPTVYLRFWFRQFFCVNDLWNDILVVVVRVPIPRLDKSLIEAIMSYSFTSSCLVRQKLHDNALKVCQ